MWDAIIVGGGPAGLSAALVLGRCRRRALVLDAGHPRNERARAMHGFLSRDGIAPAEFARICREQVRAYPNVELRGAVVSEARREHERFTVRLRDGREEHGRTILLATGVVDELPRVPGFDQFYGATIHHCPYCDGWEHRDQPLGVLGGAVEAAELACELLLWSEDVVLFTDGEATLPEEHRARLDRRGVRVIPEEVAALEGEGEHLRGVRLRNGELIARHALFFSPGQCQRAPLAEQLGCSFGADGGIECGSDTATVIEGVFAAGNASVGPQLVILAAAEGTRAAFSINEALLAADLR